VQPSGAFRASKRVLTPGTCRCLLHAPLREGGVGPATGEFSKLHQHVVKKEGEPDTFAAAFVPDQVHAVVPVATTDQRQAVLAEI
jgi:hypothetical protein